LSMTEEQTYKEATTRRPEEQHKQEQQQEQHHGTGAPGAANYQDKRNSKRYTP